MKKKLLSLVLSLIVIMLLAAGCGSSGGSGGGEGSEKGSSQILFNGSSTLAPVITAIATDFLTHTAHGTPMTRRFRKRTLPFMYQQAVPGREQRL